MVFDLCLIDFCLFLTFVCVLFVVFAFLWLLVLFSFVYGLCYCCWLLIRLWVLFRLFVSIWVLITDFAGGLVRFNLWLIYFVVLTFALIARVFF